VISKLPVLNVYKKKTKKSQIVTQLLYGDTFKKLTQKGSWIKIKNNLDGYIGYIKNRKFSSNHKNTHKVSVLQSNLYLKANSKNKIKKKLSFGSKIKITNKKGSFYKFDNLWIKKKDLKKISFKTKDSFRNISKFINVKYKWGGKHFSGVDCSGLIQLFLNFNNKFCPRDTKDQIKYFKKKAKLVNIKKNDLIFWKGHVALVMSKNRLIHGYGPLKKVVAMPIKKTIARIDKTANLKVTGIRRINV
jgi:cell wall-associated NlpC family hydrolase|tara:strand:+ start:2667 stop:3404 length:738 start_codon:yes stop_codon:yes gene_type:complete